MTLSLNFDQSIEELCIIVCGSKLKQDVQHGPPMLLNVIVSLDQRDAVDIAIQNTRLGQCTGAKPVLGPRCMIPYIKIVSYTSGPKRAQPLQVNVLLNSECNQLAFAVVVECVLALGSYMIQFIHRQQNRITMNQDNAHLDTSRAKDPFRKRYSFHEQRGVDLLPCEAPPPQSFYSDVDENFYASKLFCLLEIQIFNSEGEMDWCTQLN